MPLLWKPYKSDITSLIDELKAKNPQLEEQQRAGRGEPARGQGVGVHELPHGTALVTIVCSMSDSS
jgi:hypothetical protein